MKISFQLLAYSLLAILGMLVLIHDGEIIYCTRCGSMLRDILATVSIGAAVVGWVGTVSARNRGAANAKSY